jgi:hypothetical protein
VVKRLLLATLLCASAAAASVPKNQTDFTKFVADQVRSSVPKDVEVVVTEPLTVKMGELQLNLDRIYGFCLNNNSGCPGVVDSYVKAAVQTFNDQNAVPTRESLRLALRREPYILQIQKAFDDQRKLQPRPFVEGLLLLPVMDSPRTMRFLSLKDDETLGMSADEVFELAKANTRTALRPLKEAAKVAIHGAIGTLNGDNESSLLIFHNDWAPLVAQQNGALIAVAPETDSILYVGEDTPQAIDALRALAKQVMGHSQRPLSDVLLRWKDQGWEVVR